MRNNMKKNLYVLVLCLILIFPPAAASAAPMLKYSNAGTLSNWTEESYYASPVVCDLDFDGRKEIVFASFYDKNQSMPKIMQGSLYILNYEGKLISKTPLPLQRKQTICITDL